MVIICVFAVGLVKCPALYWWLSRKLLVMWRRRVAPLSRLACLWLHFCPQNRYGTTTTTFD